MEWLNYNHLHYFWVVVREGGIAAASRRLRVGRPAISMQIKKMEEFLGSPVFTRRGKRLTLTETGKLVHDYADDIFRIGTELVDAVRGRGPGRPQSLRVGIADVMAKLVAFRLLEPALEGDQRFALVCREDAPTRLFAELAVQRLDLVLSDTPIAPGLDVKAYNHVVGESTTTLFAIPPIARRLKRGFPKSLEGAPFLMPSKTAAIRRQLDHWLEEQDVRPAIIGEFEDSALLKVFGEVGRGVFPGPTIVREEIKKKYRVQDLGELARVRERFYVISPERKIKHPAVARIVEHAKGGGLGGV